MARTIFSKIISGELPAYKVAEDEAHLAFLDINPVKRGHVLVIPKKETDYLFDMDDEALSALLIFGKKVAAGIKQAIPCKKVSVHVIGLEVPHAHVHLIPVNIMSDCNFSGPKLNPSSAELEETADLIRKAL
jgi:histidine triad (HIT) family protein